MHGPHLGTTPTSSILTIVYPRALWVGNGGIRLVILRNAIPKRLVVNRGRLQTSVSGSRNMKMYMPVFSGAFLLHADVSIGDVNLKRYNLC